MDKREFVCVLKYYAAIKRDVVEGSRTAWKGVQDGLRLIKNSHIWSLCACYIFLLLICLDLKKLSRGT